jgi:hypothetical protein
MKYYTSSGVSMTIFSTTENPREALAASATCNWQSRKLFRYTSIKNHSNLLCTIIAQYIILIGRNNLQMV